MSRTKIFNVWLAYRRKLLRAGDSRNADRKLSVSLRKKDITPMIRQDRVGPHHHVSGRRRQKQGAAGLSPASPARSSGAPCRLILDVLGEPHNLKCAVMRGEP